MTTQRKLVVLRKLTIKIDQLEISDYDKKTLKGLVTRAIAKAISRGFSSGFLTKMKFLHTLVNRIMDSK